MASAKGTTPAYAHWAPDMRAAALDKRAAEPAPAAYVEPAEWKINVNTTFEALGVTMGAALLESLGLPLDAPPPDMSDTALTQTTAVVRAAALLSAALYTTPGQQFAVSAGKRGDSIGVAVGRIPG